MHISVRLRLILTTVMLSVGVVANVQARTDIPLVDNELNSYDARQLVKNDGRGRHSAGGHWHRFRHPEYRSGGYFWGYSAMSRWRGDYYWRTVGYRCTGGSCYKQLCLFQTGAVVAVRCETRRWRIL